VKRQQHKYSYKGGLYTEHNYKKIHKSKKKKEKEKEESTTHEKRGIF